ncbi:MAG: LamG-like jellyroll fold domain-containing protein, partial [Saprospiraceae bacterium]
LYTGFRSNNQFTFAFYGNDLNTGATYTDLNWHHWSCVYDKSIVSPSNNRFIYRDGVLVASDRSSSDLLSSGVLQIGKFDGDYFGGKIDELRIWNVARTSAEIQANQYCPMLSPPSSLELYLPFEDGIPDGDNSFDTETIDFSGNSNHGYLNNFALNGSASNFTTHTYDLIVSGEAVVCPALSWTYSVPSIAGATSYTWTLPSGWTGSSSTNSITVSPSTMSGTVQCVVAAPCGNLTFTKSVTANTNCETAIHFDGVNDYLLAPNFSWNVNEPVTVEFWTKVNSADLQNTVLFTVGNTATNDRFMAHVPWSDSNLYWDYGDSGGNGRLSMSFTPYFDKWVHVALVSAGNGGNFRGIYINGVLIASNTGASDGPNGARTSLQLGGNGDFVKSKVDEFRIWNVMRTQAEIQANKLCPITSPPSSLKIYYPFENGIPNGNNVGTESVTDFSGNNNHGFIQNMALTGSTSNFTNGTDITRYQDSDGDGFGNASVTSTLFCPAGAYSSVAGDCDDTNPNINPYATEICGNTVDDDCDGNTDIEINKGLNFNASGNQVNLPFYAHQAVFSVEAWIKVSASGTFRRILSWDGGSSSYVGVSSSNVLMYYENGGYYHGGPNLGDNQWHHVVVVHNGYAGNNITTYVDGNLQLNVPLGSVITSSTLTMGANSTGGEALNGSLDDVRIWNVALTQAQIQQRMNRRLDGNEANLVRYYTLDHGKPGMANPAITIAKDKTSNNAHGTLVGFTLTGSTSNWITSWTYPTLYADADGDGYGATNPWTCGSMTGYLTSNLDCNDNNPNINPYATEICGNSIDDDCDGNTDVEVNKGLHFNASGNRVTIPYYAHQAVFSVEAWIKVSASGTFRRIVTWGGTNTSDFAVSASNLLGYFENGSGFHGGPNIGDNQWHHVVLVHNGYGTGN